MAKAPQCIERAGDLIPQFTVVMPAESLIKAARRAEKAAMDVFNQTHMLGLLAVN